MIKILSIFFFIFTLCFVKADPPSFRILSSEVARSGQNIPILSKDRVMYVLVDLSYNSDKSYPMALHFHHSETIFVDNLFNFAPFKCELPDCSRYSNSFEPIGLADIRFYGYRVEANVYLNYDVWYFTRSDTYKPLLAYQKFDGNKKIFGTELSGILGMGAAKNGRHMPQVFSISLNKTGLAGNLIYGSDMKYAESSLPIATLIANENWIIGNGKSANEYYTIGNQNKIKVGNFYVSIRDGFRIIFDINNENIVIPLATKDQFTNHLKEYGLDCSMNNFVFTCTSYTTADRFPTVIIEIDGSDPIKISPKIYIFEDDYNPNAVLPSVRTIFRFSDEFSIVDDWEYVNSWYSDAIFLGRTFMKEHYTVFDNKAQTITLYTAASNLNPNQTPTTPTTPTTPDNNKPTKDKIDFLYIIIGCLLVIVIWALFIKKSKNDKVNIEVVEMLMRNRNINLGQNIQMSNPFTDNRNNVNPPSNNFNAQVSNPFTDNRNNPNAHIATQNATKLNLFTVNRNNNRKASYYGNPFA